MDSQVMDKVWKKGHTFVNITEVRLISFRKHKYILFHFNLTRRIQMILNIASNNIISTFCTLMRCMVIMSM